MNINLVGRSQSVGQGTWHMLCFIRQWFNHSLI